jgi:hypothetical protein
VAGIHTILSDAALVLITQLLSFLLGTDFILFQLPAMRFYLLQLNGKTAPSVPMFPYISQSRAEH